MQHQMKRGTGLVAALATVTLVMVGCEQRAEDQPPVARSDAPSATTRSEAPAASAERKLGDTAAKAGRAIDDASITASVKSALAKDPTLSAIAIDVDTANGNVALSGSAPDSNSREKATLIARAVQGVNGVDNRIVVAN